MSLHRLQAKTHQRTDSSGRRINDINLVFIYYIPKPACIGPSRNAFEHEAGGAGAQWTIYDITMAGDPTDICRAKMNIARLVLKYVHKTVVGIDHITGAGVHHPFRFAG